MPLSPLLSHSELYTGKMFVNVHASTEDLQRAKKSASYSSVLSKSSARDAKYPLDVSLLYRISCSNTEKTAAKSG